LLASTSVDDHISCSARMTAYIRATPASAEEKDASAVTLRLVAEVTLLAKSGISHR